MIDFARKDKSGILITVNSNLFNKKIQTKVLYWLITEFHILWEESGEISKITLNKKKGIIDAEEFRGLYDKINQDFLDFKARDIIHNETKSIKEILLIKAFANNDSFEDYFLINNKEEE